ncbi:MAG: mobilization protein [Candidatus Micrarchaeum sp. ARMAN-1]|nr:MAG: mobilization protein [Candidatus Micrarchaeum sp. ARMAN-1]
MARPKGDPAKVRGTTIGVRVTDAEYAVLREKAAAMAMSPAQWLREAALKRRLPSPPVPAINVAEYGKLARLSANLNQLVRLAHEGRPVTINEDMIRHLLDEVSRLRLSLLGQGGEDA